MIDYLFNLGKEIIGENDINKVLKIAIDSAIEISGAEHGMIIFFDDDNDILFAAARDAEKKDIENPETEISTTIINRVKETGEMICLKNAIENRKLEKSKSAIRLKIFSVLCIGFRKEGKIFGVIYLDNRKKAGVFQNDTCVFMNKFVEFISLAAQNAVEKKELIERVSSLEQEIRCKSEYETIIGHHPKMLKVMDIISQIASSDICVLVQGESGTGKELIARAIHFKSNRREKPFIPINCAAIPESLLESELFGYVKGAFTGAMYDKKGWFETGNEGTIFLDEIAEMSPILQAKLLRILESGEYASVGDNNLKFCDVRIVAATNKNLNQLMAQNAFREDLYYRLNVLTIKLPPLRERKTDLSPLINHFLNKYTPGMDKPKKLSKTAGKFLLSYSYPGNVRELENAIQRAVTISHGDVILPEHLPDEILNGLNYSSGEGRRSTLNELKKRAAEEVEKDFVYEYLKIAQGNISGAAQLANMDTSNFYKMIKKHQLNPSQFKASMGAR